MPTFAAIDIGANSVRLKIARLARGRLKAVHEDREVTRLGASVFRTGLLEPEAMARTVKALERFRKAVQEQRAEVVRAVATSALRDARNRQAFVDWVRSATGWTVEVISGLEEGRLIHLGIMGQARWARARALLIDLGGGSCELTFSDAGHIREMHSLPLGAVRLTSEFLHHDPPKKRELARMREYIRQEVRRVEARIRAARADSVLATSGTAAALAAAAGGASKAASRAQVARMAARLAEMNAERRQAVRGIGPRRAEIIVAGAAVFDELMHGYGLRAFRYSDLGLRDGLLAQMAADHGGRARRQVEAEREDALLETCRKYKADVRQAQRVREIAAQLFAALRRVHGLPGAFEDWLLAAAMLSEIGSIVNRTGRHRHTFYLIAHAEIFGFTPRERRLIATIARFVGTSKPSPGSKIMLKLRAAEQERVRRAIVLLRMARSLNQGRRGAVTGVTAAERAGAVTLRLETRGGAELELWALAKERGNFREVFGREMRIVAG